ncbi:MAG TPA: hypothetical protein VH277_17060, partial [Gemmatimonadaceae bacterium]|nr:hypothetical protein [Gemmatimonadaceae bacterium]
MGRATFLGSLGGDPALTSARAISENGIVVGTAATASGVMHAFLWTDTSGMLDLGAPNGRNSTSVARGVSSNGMVVGEGTDGLTGLTHAFRWTTAVIKTQNGRATVVEMKDLGAPGVASTAAAVNASGWAVGRNNGQAYLWNPGTPGLKNGDAVLDRRGGPESQAYAINDLEEIAGTLDTPTGPHAFFAAPQLGLKDLGTASGTASQARAMNDAGQVVGWITAAKSTMPFIWSEADGMTLLETVQDAKIEATAINSLGEVAGNIAGRAGSTPFFWSREGRIIQEIPGLTASIPVFGMDGAHRMVGSNRLVPFTPNVVPVAAPVAVSTWENAPVTFTLPAGSGVFDNTIYTYSFSSSSGPLSKTAITGT